MAAGKPGVYLRGLTDLQRVLKRADRELAKSLGRSLREIGKSVQASTREVARRFRDSGNLEKSVRYSVTQKAASVYSNVVYAPVHEWGGAIHPRGVPIHIPRREWMGEGVRNARRETDSSLERVLDDVSRDFGRGA